MVPQTGAETAARAAPTAVMAVARPETPGTASAMPRSPAAAVWSPVIFMPSMPASAVCRAIMPEAPALSRISEPPSVLTANESAVSAPPRPMRPRYDSPASAALSPTNPAVTAMRLPDSRGNAATSAVAASRTGLRAPATLPRTGTSAAPMLVWKFCMAIWNCLICSTPVCIIRAKSVLMTPSARAASSRSRM